MRWFEKNLLALICGATFVISGTSVTQAQFTLTIDTNNNTWAFTGTDTGTGDPALGPPGGSSVEFGAVNPALDIFFDQGVGSSFSVVGAPGVVIAANLGYRPAFVGTVARAEFFITLNATGTQTITADGTEFSFASQPLEDQLQFESLIGTTLTLEAGTGFSPISVVAATAVPEPSALTLLIAAMCPLALKRKRNAL